MSKFLIFAKVFNDVVVLNKKSGYPLGKIEYYKPWKQYVFSAVSDAVFNDECLIEIASKIKKLKKENP